MYLCVLTSTVPEQDTQRNGSVLIFFINGDQIIFCPEFGRIDCKSNPIGQPIIPDGFSRFYCLQRLGYVAGSSETFYGLTECIGGKGTVQAVEVQSDARRDSNLFVDRQPEPS